MKTSDVWALNKRMFVTVGVVAFALPAFAGTSAAAGNPTNPLCCETPEQDLGFTVSVGYDSSYVFRGAGIGSDYISTALSLDLPIADNVKAAFDASYGSLADDDDTIIGGQSYDRLDLGAGIAYEAGAAEFGLGYRWYHHMADLSGIMEDGHEVGLTLATSVGPVNLGLGGYHDFGVDGWYFEAAVNTDIKVCEGFSIVPGANIGYAADYNWHVDNFASTSFTHGGVSLAFPIKLTSCATLTPYVAANFPLNPLDATVADDNIIYGGVSLSVRF